MLPVMNRIRFVRVHVPLFEHLRIFCSQPASNSKLFVAVSIMYDKNSGRSRGFGFVQFSNEDDAKYAKDVMDGKVLLGRPLRISYDLERVHGAPVVVPCISSTEPKD